MKIAQLPQTYIVLSSFQGFESLRREIVRGSRNKWFLVIATFSTKQKGWVGIAEWTQPCRTDAHPDSATKSPSPVTRFPSVFCSVKSLFKCRDLTGTSENCFPWSAYPIIMTTVSKEKLISYEKWQSSNKMWPWIQMYLYRGKKCPFHSVYSDTSLVTQGMCFLKNLSFKYLGTLFFMSNMKNFLKIW